MPRRSFPEADIGNGAQQFGGADDCYADKAAVDPRSTNGRISRFSKAARVGSGLSLRTVRMLSLNAL